MASGRFNYLHLPVNTSVRGVGWSICPSELTRAFSDNTTFYQAPIRVLDLGSGRGTKLVELLLQNPDVVGTSLDAFEENHRKNPQRTEKVVGDARDMPFSRDSFDIVVCAELTTEQDYLKDCKSMDALRAQIARVTAQNGYLVAYSELQTLAPKEFSLLVASKERDNTRFLWAIYQKQVK